MSVGAASTREAYFVGRRTRCGRRGGRVVGGIYLWTVVGFWAWSLPAPAVLVPLAAMDRAQIDSREGGR